MSIAHQTSIVSFNHRWDNTDIPIKYNDVECGEIVIEDDVWCGCGVRPLSGARIGRRAVIAAGAVVTGQVHRGEIVGGVPAKPIGRVVG